MRMRARHADAIGTCADIVWFMCTLWSPALLLVSFLMSNWVIAVAGVTCYVLGETASWISGKCTDYALSRHAAYFFGVLHEEL